MTETEIIRELGALTKDKNRWEASIPFLSSLLASESTKIRAKALWLLGEVGLAFPCSIRDHVPAVAAFLNDPEALLRERAVIALGRIGRGSFSMIEPYWEGLLRFAFDEAPNVRLSFIWASENIAVNTPDPYEKVLPVFAELLQDPDEKVRMEAPEIFRVLGKRRPSFVRPYIEQLRTVSENDSNRVVQIHCLGAIRASVSDTAVKP